jgi:tetratricopeptide (TPR) repeat protein
MNTDLKKAADSWVTAKWYLDRLISVIPDDGGLYADRAQVFEELGKSEERAADLDMVIRHGTDPFVLLEICNEIAEQRDWSKVVQIYERATGLAAIPLVDWYQYGLALVRTGDTESYRAACESLMGSLADRELPASTVSLLAWMCAIGPSNSPEANKAITLAERLLTATPLGVNTQRYAVLNTLGALHLRSGDPDRAVVRLNEGLLANSNGGDLTNWALLAIAHYQLDNKDDAEKWLEKAEAVDLNAVSDVWEQLEKELFLHEAQGVLGADQHKR